MKVKYIAKHGVLFYVTDDGKIYSENNVLLSHYVDKVGYHSVVGRDCNNKAHRYLVHRLVAGAFIGDIEGYQVHHIDGNKGNNKVSNLEIKTQAEHDKIHKWKYPEYAHCVICGKLFKPYETKRKDPKVCSKECNDKYMRLVNKDRFVKVKQFDMNDNFIKEFESLSDGAREVGGAVSNIIKCCKGEIKSHKGYHWRYSDDC